MLQTIELKDESGTPAVRALVKRAHGRSRPPARREPPDQPVRFGRRESEFRPLDDLDRLSGTMARELGGRLAAADDDESYPPRHLLERRGEDFVQLGGGRHLLVVVEHHREGRREPAVKLAEEAPGEDAEPLPVLGRQERKRSLTARSGAAEIVEEGRGVSVACVDLVPEGALPAGGQIAGHQRGFARPWRRPNPSRRTCGGTVEETEEPWPCQSPSQRRPRGLGKRHQRLIISHGKPLGGRRDARLRDTGRDHRGRREARGAVTSRPGGYPANGL